MLPSTASSSLKSRPQLKSHAYEELESARHSNDGNEEGNYGPVKDKRFSISTHSLSSNGSKGNSRHDSFESLPLDELLNVKHKSSILLRLTKHSRLCFPFILVLAFGILIGATFTQRNIRGFEKYEEFCHVMMDITTDNSFCFSHELTAPPAKTAFEMVPNSKLNFLVIGDWGRNGHCCQHDVALEMSRVENIDFVINTGDNFYENGIRSKDASKVRNSWYNVYNKNNLIKIPWYGVLGNHDYKGKPEVQLEIQTASVDYSSWKIPDRNYKRVQGNVLFVFVDTTPLLLSYRTDSSIAPQLDDSKDLETQRKETLNFISDNLKIAANELGTIKWKLVIGHHPVVTIGEHYGQDEDLFMESTFSTFLQAHNVSAYISGHDHNLQHLQQKNVHFIISGAGSQVRPLPSAKVHISSFDGSDDKPVVRFHYGSQGFVGVSVSDEMLLIQFINLRGAWLYSKLLDPKNFTSS